MIGDEFYFKCKNKSNALKVIEIVDDVLKSKKAFNELDNKDRELSAKYMITKGFHYHDDLHVNLIRRKFHDKSLKKDRICIDPTLK